MVYFMQGAITGNIKIGMTKSFRQRFSELNSSDVLVCLNTIEMHDDIETETDLHHKFRHLRIHGEWFTPGKDLLEYIAALPKSEHAGRRQDVPLLTTRKRPNKEEELMLEHVSYDLGYAAYGNWKPKSAAQGMGEKGTPQYTRTRSMWIWGYEDAEHGVPNRQERPDTGTGG
jgi:hypothetical protein